MEKKEISNKTLVMLLLATLGITLFGTAITLNRISGLQSLTGAWENGGATRASINFSIIMTISINFTQDRASFGTGYVSNGSAACLLITSNANIGCGGFNNNVKPLLLENTGSVNVKLNLSNSNNSASLIGGTGPGYAWLWNDPENDGSNDTCVQAGPTNIGAEDVFRSIGSSSEQLNASSMLCSMFNASDENDLVNISFRLLIPLDAPLGSGRSDTWTATAALL